MTSAIAALRRGSDDAATGSTAEDEAAIRALFAALLAAWARGDGRAYGALFADDAAYIAFDGSIRRGREAIDREHQQLFDTFLRGTRLVGEITDIRFLGPDAALLHATGGTIGKGKARPAPEKDSIQTFAVARRDGAWRFVAFHNTRVRPIGPGFGAIMAWLGTDLLWKMLRRGHGARG